MTNFDLSTKVFNFLQQAGVENIIVCAGARNAPFVVALEKTQSSMQTNFKIYHFFEERSSAFFALGLMKQAQRPVAILTTSGTAVAELLPAVIEAYYQGLPLIVISADRPKSYRGTGAPQAIEQVGIFSNYVSQVYDFDVTTEIFNFELDSKMPLHLNVCFDEPLIDLQSHGRQPIIQLKIKQQKSSSYINRDELLKFKQPFVILGELSKQQVPVAKKFILDNQLPVYAESLSHLRHDKDLKPYLIFSSDLLVKKIFQNKLCDSIIRFGGVPTLRFWRDLESEFKHLPVFQISDLDFIGLARNSYLTIFSELPSYKFDFSKSNLNQIKQLDVSLLQVKNSLLEKYPLSEQVFVLKISLIIEEQPIYLGNSLPIRHWDQFATNQTKQINANRGANGIDGQISTYLGWSEDLKKSFCLIGDLTALYDLASLGLTEQLKTHSRTIIVLNNFGGQIFNRLFKNDMFINSHKTQFEHWAQMWNWNYQKITKTSDFQQIKVNQINTIVEVQPNEEQTNLFWSEWDLLCQKL